MTQQDCFQRFLFEEFQIRGELVRLNQSYQEIQARKDYPDALRRLLGEALVATTLLGGTLKYEGTLSLQAKGDGAVQLLMAESTHDRQIRGIAQWQGEVHQADLPTQLGSGMLVITIDPTQGSRYQGFVPLEKHTLAACLEQYFELSEQLETMIIIAANEHTASGLLLQKLPSKTCTDEDAWNRITSLAKSTSDQELHSLDYETLLFRLFHEEAVTLYAPETVAFHCSCSQNRTENALRAMGAEETAQLLTEKPAIDVECQFCGKHYRFDSADVARIFGKNILH